MSKDTFYFSHDYNARSDEKIKNLIKKQGMLGYGIFWAIVEDLYNNANALRTDYEGIAYDLRTEKEIIKSVINDFGLFSIKNGFFGSASISRRIDARNEKSAKARESAFRRWGKNANAPKKNANAPKIDAIKERKGYKGYKGKGEPKNPSPFIDKIIEVYVESFPDTVNAYSGKNRNAVGRLLRTWKGTHPEQTTEETLTSLKEYFTRCKNISDAWYAANMSLSLIDSKFTEIGRILNNPKRKHLERPQVLDSDNLMDMQR